MSYLTLRYEESPRHEGAAMTTPYRLASERFYYAVRSGRLVASPAYMDRSDELRGQLSPTAMLVDRYEPAGAIGIRTSLNALAPLLGLAGLEATITEGDGTTVMDPDDVAVPAGVFLHEFAKRPGSTAQSAELIAAYTEADTYELGQGYGVGSLAMPANGELSADLVGLVCKATTDPALTPSYDSLGVEPIRSRHLLATFPSLQADLTDFSLTITNPLERVTHYGIRSAYPGRLEMSQWVSMTGSAGLHQFTPEARDAALSASTFSATAHWRGESNIGATNYPYQLWVDIPACQVTGGQGADELTGTRRFGAQYEWMAAYDDDAGYDFKVTVACAVETVATYS